MIRDSSVLAPYLAGTDALLSDAEPEISLFAATPSASSPEISATLSSNVRGATKIVIDTGVGDVSRLTSERVFPAAAATYTTTVYNDAGMTIARTPVTVIGGQRPENARRNIVSNR